MTDGLDRERLQTGDAYDGIVWDGNGKRPSDYDPEAIEAQLRDYRDKHQRVDDTLELLGREIPKMAAAGELPGPEAHEPRPDIRDLTRNGDGDGQPDPMFIHWPTFWSGESDDADWVYEDVIARGRSHALVAPHKRGKSQLLLHLAVRMATGDDPVVVVYLDYEMTEDDIHDRLEEMGYGPESDLSRLKYALLPSLPPFDTEKGGEAVCALVEAIKTEWSDHHVVLIVDTITRAVQGKENDSDTWDDLNRHTGAGLKRRGATWVRADQMGKDPGRGARGSSGKGDDVDLEWHLDRADGGVVLKRSLCRTLGPRCREVRHHRGPPRLRADRPHLACRHP